MLIKHYIDPVEPMKLQFFAFIAEIVKPYLSIFQTNRLMVPFMWWADKNTILTPMLSISQKYSGRSWYNFAQQNIDKKHFCQHDKNYCYFCKSNIPVINLIVDSRNMIKVSKNMSCFHQIPNNFLAFFIAFEWGRILESAMDK